MRKAVRCELKIEVTLEPPLPPPLTLPLPLSLAKQEPTFERELPLLSTFERWSEPIRTETEREKPRAAVP